MLNLFGDKYKKIMDNYFKRQEKAHLETFGHKPMRPYTLKVPLSIYTSEPNSEKWATWKPIPAEQINWDEIEKELGFKINKELKKYFGIYRFFDISGEYKKFCYYFTFFGLKSSTKEDIIAFYKIAQDYKPNTELFCLGSVSDDKYDGYALYYDNKTNKMFFVDHDFDKVYDTNLSIFELIDKLKGI